MSENVQTLLKETRKFQPPIAESVGFEKWYVESLDEYKKLHARSIQHPDAFWAEEAQRLSWFKHWDHVLDWTPPDAKWFVGGKLNACYNCVDRHVQSGHGDECAIVWEGEPVNPRTNHPAPGSAYAQEPEIRRVTYRELEEQTSRIGNALKELGVQKGDVVTGSTPGRTDPAMFAQLFFTDANSNPDGHLIPEVTAAYEQALQPLPDAEREPILQELMTQTVEQAGNVVANFGYAAATREPPSQRYKEHPVPEIRYRT